MNVLLLTNHLNIGGISSYCLTLAQGLREKGHSVYVGSSGGELLGRFRELGTGFLALPVGTKAEVHPLRLPVSLARLVSFARLKNIHLFHANTRVTQVAAALASSLTSRPYISTCHGFFKRRIGRRILPCWGRRVIAISEAVKEHLLQDFALSPERVCVIHSGIDAARFRAGDGASREAHKQALGFGPHPLVGIIARLSDVKGHAYLIRAMQRVRRELPQAVLVIAGEGKMEKELKGLVAALGLQRGVVFMPSLEDTTLLLSALDVFVMPSLAEGLGLGIMEAMACGLPVVGTAVGGIKSLIRHRQNGLLVGAKDEVGLAQAILEVLKDPKQASAWGLSGRAFIEENFSQERMVLETERIYLECAYVNH